MTPEVLEKKDDISSKCAHQLEPSWFAEVGSEFEKPYMQKLKNFLRSEKDQRKTIYPHSQNIFRAFELTPFNQVRVVILGQDPYHGPNQAHGLCFSVQPGVKPPPSLVNIFKEIQQDLNIKQPLGFGFLEHWAKQGVLLLNSVLTVEKGQAASHQGQGWEQFTDVIISHLNKKHENIVYVLWGSYAQKKASFVDENKNLVLRSTHPSPLSAHRGFLGCQHFSKINDYLISKGMTAIDWQLPLIDS